MNRVFFLCIPFFLAPLVYGQPSTTLCAVGASANIGYCSAISAGDDGRLSVESGSVEKVNAKPTSGVKSGKQLLRQFFFSILFIWLGVAAFQRTAGAWDGAFIGMFLSAVYRAIDSRIFLNPPSFSTIRVYVYGLLVVVPIAYLLWRIYATRKIHELSFDGGETYVGNFFGGEFCGQGTYTWASGRKYVGEWRDGKFHGVGSMVYSDGAEYVGGWKDGKRNGEGSMLFSHGTRYVGQWRHDKINGRGTKTYTDGGAETGWWKDGEFLGSGLRGARRFW